MTTTDQTTKLSSAPSDNGDMASRSRARQAVSTARTKATTTARQNPKSTTASLLAIAGAAVAAVVLSRRRTAAKAAVPRNRLAALLHR
ncbi:hypothetical protein AMIS_36970 [Actinoplanes missouriensis 431]|uniref:Uncharacterized protein n=1 Tax=Actinoplanes missouriensis (strain ATCC 14538 / DSM 43046 / CBS 188.64 / JCM 3121 / NBRC 102363 / NCIMB 12654 / NRRL B-3342 / UNCC 431) TaxID=512565 RepID=I0H7D0_ACTM4|nr:hypothetical protein [Actinoplanes missouriensis]BAL88917.1 hypothetical protein AMIS_36970 [Actinoplanes missouriensis 431]